MQPFEHVMVDIETLGTRPDAAIVTIGAVAFDFDSGGIQDRKFYVNINPRSAEQVGCSVDIGTVMWWMQQPEAARNALISSNALTLTHALTQLTEFLQAVRATNRSGRLSFWANDPDFDAKILATAYQLCGLATPWQFWETRSCRTMLALGQRYKFEAKKELPRTGTHHNAVDDAEYQARCIMAVQAMLDAHHRKATE